LCKCLKTSGATWSSHHSSGRVSFFLASDFPDQDICEAAILLVWLYTCCSTAKLQTNKSVYSETFGRPFNPLSWERIQRDKSGWVLIRFLPWRVAASARLGRSQALNQHTNLEPVRTKKAKESCHKRCDLSSPQQCIASRLGLVQDA
jgi:hypothetical protein